jgi:hypothetical protein
MKAASCPVCGHRKGKRPCPAKSSAICSVCCGTKRQVEIDCPPDCTYLTGAHAPGWDGRESDRRRDWMRLAPAVERLGQDEAAIFFYLLAGMVKIANRLRDTDDAQWLEAVTALRKTAETRGSGLVYEHAAEGFRSKELVREMNDVLTPPGQDRPVADERVLQAALRALEDGLTATRRENAGPAAFLETARRMTVKLVTDPGEKREDAQPRILEP